MNNLVTNTNTDPVHRAVSRQEWIAARKELLAKEKELMRLRDQLAAERHALPWVKIEKQYFFDAPEGKLTLADLFDGRSQLFIKHFMMGPGQEEQCVGCSLEVLSVVSGVRRRRAAGEQDEADRRGIPDTTTCTKPLEKAYGDWFPSC
jgi:predicted dithiol-disulfide oxidoreductase (DUF899 family)